MELEIKGFRPFYLLFIIRDYFVAKYSLHYTWYARTKNNQLLGYCVMYHRTVHKLVVRKDLRRRGIATQLVPEYANFAKASREGVKFYESLGFKLVDTSNGRHIMVKKS